MTRTDYSLGALTNIVTLLLGLLLGYVLGTSRVSTVIAQEPPHPAIEEVMPNISAGAAAFNTLIAHRVSSDSVVVNDYDLLKLDNGILNLLLQKRIARYSEVDQMVEQSMYSPALRLKLPPKPPSSSATPNGESK